MTHPLPQNISQEEANQFIIFCHSDLESVKTKVTEKPEIVNVYNPQAHETALGAAGHIGRRDIAEFLLDNGAVLELAAAAMLGMRDEVTEWLSQDATLAASGGAHNIPVAFHAAMSGDTEIMQLLWDHGAEEQVKNSLHGTIMQKEQIKMARWLLEHDANLDVKNFRDSRPIDVAQEKGYSEIAKLLGNND